MAQSLPTPPNSPGPICSYTRNQLKSLRTQSERDIPQHKRFFPEYSVRQFFSKTTVEALLVCSCATCQRHRRLQHVVYPAGYASSILADRSRDQTSGSGYVVLLALLVHIECPALIFTFIHEQYGDGLFKRETAKLTGDYVLRTFWQKFPPDDVKLYADDFDGERYKFTVPRIEGDCHEEYPSETILPFVNERRLGREGANGEIISEGHFGDVYSFNILEGYCGFSVPGIHTFARKELRRNTPLNRFRDERDNLYLVKKLEDKHLIKIVKSYKHGDVYNFIFPCAVTNLDLFLRQPSFHPFPHYSGTVLGHPIWEQFLGIARGLHKVLDYEIPDSKLENALYGYHFDLKPANILVDCSGNFVITDFGQARFKNVNGTSSKVTGVGGNEAYAPPEIDEDRLVNNRRYDIWSLGCILVEVCAFAVRGHKGLRDLDRIRSKEDLETHTHDDRFFRRAPISVMTQLSPGVYNSGTYELKPQIFQWIQFLPQSVPDDPSRIFIKKILQVALGMLNVDVQARLTSKKVCLYLSDVISHQQVYDEDNPQATSKPPSEGFDVRTDLMAKISPISYNLEGYWNTAPTHFVQESALLHVQVFENRKWVRRSLGIWSQLNMIPQYAMRSGENSRNSDDTIFFPPNSQSGPSQRRYGKFSTPDILILQEIFLAQKVHKSLQLNSATVEPLPAGSLSKFIHRKSSGRKSNDAPLTMEVDASCVQLWTESLRYDKIGPDAAARRQSPRSLRLRPDPIRVVVFYEKSILILRLARNERIEPRSNSDCSSTSIKIVPTDKTKDPSFPVSILRAKSDESLPGFPLSKDNFEAQEMQERTECSSLNLDFGNKDKADSFQRNYKILKKQWSEQLKRFESLQNHISEEIGYFQST